MDERVVETIAGYARASAYQEKERMDRLARMSTEESLAIFTDLVESAENMPLSDEEAGRLLRWRLETIIAVRKALIKLAQVKGLM